jgi:hypothetical protein
MSTSALERQQLDIAARLESLAEFATVPVTVIRPRSEGEALQIQTTLDQALAGLVQKGGKSGAAVIVQMPTATVPERNVPEDISLALISTPPDLKEIAGVDQNSALIGAIAIDHLVSLINLNERGLHTHSLKILVDGSWVNGSSCPPIHRATRQPGLFTPCEQSAHSADKSRG